MKTVLGIFRQENNAERAIDTLKDNGYDAKDISLIMRDKATAQRMHERTGSHTGEGAVSGAATGAVVGGIAGLLIGIGAIAVPGIGALLIGGPIAAALGLTGAAATTASGAVTGALAGGIIGALAGLGVPKEQAEVYERRIKEGAILVAVPAQEADEDRVVAVLEENDASDVQAMTLKTKYEGSGYHKTHDNHHKDDGHTLVNPIQVEKYLKHVHYPADKEELMATADKEGADENVLHTLDIMPSGRFNNPKDISRAIGRI